MAIVLTYIGSAIAAHAVAGGAMAAFGTFVATYATVIATGSMIIASAAYSSAQQRKLKKSLGQSQATAAIDQGRNVMVRDPISPWRLIYGQIPVSGPIFFWEISGTNGEYLNLAITVAHHECEELGTIRFEGVEVPLDGSGNATGTYAGYVRIRKFLGIAAGERDLTWEGELPGIWTATMLGKHVARLHIQLKHNPDLFVNGLPTITCMVKGKKVYDFRTATTGWTANAALCTADFLMDVQFGKGIAQARIIAADVIEAANISDEAVVLADASTEPRYQLNGSCTADQDPDGVILDLTAGMAGYVSDPGGLWSIRAGAWRTPTLTLGDGDMCGTFSMVPRQSRQDTYNGVKGTYLSAINNWSPADFPAIKNDTYMGWDGGKRLWKDVTYNWTTSPSLAQRLAKIDLEAGRQQIIFSGDFMLKAMQCQPGDVIQFTRARLGWTNKYFEVERWDFKFMQAGDGPALAIALTVRETAEGVYDWADGEETTVDLALNTSMIDPRSVPTPATPTLSTSNFQQNDGTITHRLKVAITPPANDRVTNGGYTEVEYKKHADATWLVWNPSLRGNATEEYITDVQGAVSYDVRLRHRVGDVRGSYSATATATVSTDVTAPATPTSLLALAGPGCVIMDWTENTESDLALYELYRNTINTFPGGLPFWSGRASQYSDFGGDIGGLVVATTYYYWLKAVDATNNKSAQTSSVNAAPNSTTGATGAPGSPGAAGINNAVAFLYQRASSPPSVPAGTLTYTFATGILSGTLGSWSQNVPADNGQPLYVTIAAASSNTATDTIGTGEWASPVVQTLSGLQAATLNLYQRASSTPSLPGSTLTFTFATGALSGSLGSWSQTIPAVNGNPCYVTHASALASAIDTTDTIGTGEWSAAVKMVQDGADGAPGAPGAPGADGADGGSVVGETSGASNLPNTTYVDILSVTVAVDGTTHQITASVQIINQHPAARTVVAQLYRDSTPIGTTLYVPQAAGPNTEGSLNIAAADTPGAGTYTYKLKAKLSASPGDTDTDGVLIVS